MSPRTGKPTRGIVIRWPCWYDIATRVHFLGRDRQFRERTVRLARIVPGETVLDVGCGTGDLTMAVKERAGAAADVRGIDPAAEMIRAAERKAAERDLGIRFEIAAIEELPFPEDDVDVVVSSLMLHHLPADLKRKGIAEVARVVRSGGRFLADDIDPPLMGNLRIVEEALRANGFESVDRGRTGHRAVFFPVHYLAGTAAVAR